MSRELACRDWSPSPPTPAVRARAFVRLPADSSRAPAAGEQRWVAAVTAASSAEVLKPDVLAAVYERTAKKIKEHFAHVPEELRLKKIELNRAETRVHTFIEFIAAGRATPGLANALGQAEEKVKALTVDVASMESAKDHAFTPPPRAWIEGRVKNLNELLAARTERSALALRRLTGSVLTPKKPEVGRPYFQAVCKVDSLNLLIADGGSNLLEWWRRRESNRLLRMCRSSPNVAKTTRIARRKTTQGDGRFRLRR